MKIITTTYPGPDLDGYGSAFAYAELLRKQGKDAEAHIWNTPLLEVQWVLNTFTIPAADGPVNDLGSTIVLLDASEPEDLPDKEMEPGQVIEIIDHRKVSSTDEFKNASCQIELVGAAATLVAERFKKENITPSRESAILLYGGIVSNTQNFTALTTDRDRQMATWLSEQVKIPSDFAEQMFLVKSDLSGDKLKEEIIKDNKIFNLHGHSVGIAQLEIINTQSLLQNRQKEIGAILNDIKNDNDCKYTFINIRDLDLGMSYIVCADTKTAEMLREIPDTEWNDHVGRSKTLTLRKEIAAWVKGKLSDIQQ